MIRPWRRGPEYYIDQFCVAPRFQRKGLGSAFLRETERLLAAAKAAEGRPNRELRRWTERIEALIKDMTD